VGRFFDPVGLVAVSESGESVGAEIARALPARRALGVLFTAGFFTSAVFAAEAGFAPDFDLDDGVGFEEAVVFLAGAALVAGVGFAAAFARLEAAGFEEAVVFLAGVALVAGVGFAAAFVRLEAVGFGEAVVFLVGAALVAGVGFAAPFDRLEAAGFGEAVVFLVVPAFVIGAGFAVDERLRERRAGGVDSLPVPDPAISQAVLTSTTESPAFRSITLLPAATRVWAGASSNRIVLGASLSRYTVT
jgi:hypothetical protein